MNMHDSKLIPGELLSADPDLTLITAEIVAAYVSNNDTPIDELPSVINSVFLTLRHLSDPAPLPTPARQPAVSIRASVKPDKVTCLDCGFAGKMLKRHLDVVHNIAPEQYRARWNLPVDHPLVAPDYAEKRRELAKKIGLGRKPGGRR